MKNHIKKFGSFVNEGRKFRSELVGGMGQKAQYDALDSETQAELEDSFAELSGDPELAKMFVSGMSSYNSIEDIKAGLENVLDILRNPRTEEDEPNWDMSNY
jgi:hypothetical protein